ncbi:MAG: class I SAM-dependent methyltransferase [Candidatus Eremiobacteraeota bacterium]|nr:class I SAM-dependent methyltransferase [Candidatus Eremiobacteraeota bacterium]
MDLLAGAEVGLSVFYFDHSQTAYALSSEAMQSFTLSPEQVATAEPVAGTRALTDLCRYYRLPVDRLNQPEAPAPDARAQQYFHRHDAWKVSLQALRELGVEVESSLTIGSTPASVIEQALTEVAASRADRFLDLGCGCGLPTLVAAGRVGQALGVDVVPGVIDFARRAAQDLDLPARFEVGDIRYVDLEQVDIVYVGATGFGPSLRARLAEKMAELRPGAVVISVTYSLEGAHLALVRQKTYHFSWGRQGEAHSQPFYFQVRRPA